MGIEYCCYLIPRPNTFRPSPDAALALVEALRNDGWLLSSDPATLARLPFQERWQHGYFARTVGRRDSFTVPLSDLFENFAQQDLMVVWDIESLGASGLRYPLDPLPFDAPSDAAECYYQVQLHFGRDFICHNSEYIDPFDPSPVCWKCGQTFGECEPESEEDPFFTTRLAAHCPRCGVAFDPTRLVTNGRDGWTGNPIQVGGGAVYRFAVVVDCGKDFGMRKHRFHPELKSLVERTLKIETYEVEDFY